MVGFSLTRVVLFIGCITLLIALITSIWRTSPGVDPFVETEVLYPKNVDGLAEFHIAVLKRRHAKARSQPYDVGLFGNSRILSVGRDDLTLGACTLFNFALSGQSFRSTVSLIERLAEDGSLPRNIVISLDNFELQLASNPSWLVWKDRFALIIDDAISLFPSPSVPLRDKARLIWRYLSEEARQFKSTFEIAFFRRAFLSLLGWDDSLFAPVGDGKGGYFPDGSFWYPRPIPKDAGQLTRTTNQIIEEILRRDLERLFGLIEGSGSEILIYESPLNPISAQYFKT